jgi:hypothetical protein
MFHCFQFRHILSEERRGGKFISIQLYLSDLPKVHSLPLDHCNYISCSLYAMRTKTQNNPPRFPHMHSRELINGFTPPFHVSDLPVGQQDLHYLLY